MRATPLLLVATLLLLCVAAVVADEKSGVNEEGFVTHWLVLAPIPFGDVDSGTDALGKEWLKDEAKLKPKAGDKVKTGGKNLVWKEHTAADHLLDFNTFLNGQTEDSVGYAVTFLTAPEEMKKVRMKTGSDDQCKVYLNGAEVFKYAEARAGDKDQDSTEVTLQKGVNVLVVKVVNEKVDWSFCVRFTDKDDKPLTKLTSKTAP